MCILPFKKRKRKEGSHGYISVACERLADDNLAHLAKTGSSSRLIPAVEPATGVGQQLSCLQPVILAKQTSNYHPCWRARVRSPYKERPFFNFLCDTDFRNGHRGFLLVIRSLFNSSSDTDVRNGYRGFLLVLRFAPLFPPLPPLPPFPLSKSPLTCNFKIFESLNIIITEG